MMYKILVVDDEPEIVKILEEFFIKMDFEVVTAAGGEEAIEVLKSDIIIDLIVLDMKMPKIKGIDVLEKMKSLNKKIPVITLTGSIDAQKHKEQFEKLGYSSNDVCYKPVDLRALLDVIKKKLSLETK